MLGEHNPFCITIFIYMHTPKITHPSPSENLLNPHESVWTPLTTRFVLMQQYVQKLQFSVILGFMQVFIVIEGLQEKYGRILYLIFALILFYLSRLLWADPAYVFYKCLCVFSSFHVIDVFFFFSWNLK